MYVPVDFISLKLCLSLLWNMMPCGLVKIFQQLERTWCLKFLPWR